MLRTTASLSSSDKIRASIPLISPSLSIDPISDNADDYPNGTGLSRKHLMASIDASLKRLQLEYVDVFQCHRFDYNTPIEETMEGE